jgi:hypothetical protein
VQYKATDKEAMHCVAATKCQAERAHMCNKIGNIKDHLKDYSIRLNDATTCVVDISILPYKQLNANQKKVHNIVSVCIYHRF